MKEKKYNLIIFLIILSQIIDVPSSVNSQKLDNIIYLGGSGFAYSNFATFSNGSLVIESSEDKGSTTRIFYGITKDGNPLFESNNYFLSLSVADNYQRKDSENFIITMNDGTQKEYLISLGNNLYIEIYDLGAKSVVHKFKSDTYSGVSMDSVVQTAISYSDGSNFYIYHAYLNTLCFLIVKKLKFNSPSSYDTVKDGKEGDIYGKIAACFMTKKKYIICLAIYNKYKLASLTSSYIYVYVFGESLGSSVYEKQLDSYTINFDSNTKTYPYFYKALHLKEEIGVFAFYKESKKYLNLVFKKYDSINNNLIEYIPSITLNKYETNVTNLLNDIIKIDESKLCFFSTSDNKEVMYIVLISIYDTTKTAIRYYVFNIFNTYQFKFYINMRGNLYNNFISFSFSFCTSSSCATNSDTHYPGLIIFSYPNGTDTNIDLINEMINTNKKIDSLTINLKNQVRIDNNIFGLEYYNIQIADIKDCGSIAFISSEDEGTVIGIDDDLSEDENIIAKNFPLEKTKCQIWYYYFITEPSFETYNSYATEEVFPSDYDESYFNNDLYQSRLLNYNITINETLTEECDDDNCLLCQVKDTSHCIICKYKYLIHNTKSEKYKTCVTEGVNITNNAEDFDKETDPPTTAEAKENEKTEKPTQKETDKATQKETEKEAETEKETEKETQKEAQKETKTTNINIFTENVITQVTQEISCNYSEILSNKCHNGKLNNTQISDVKDIMKEIYLTDSNKEESTVVVTENVVYQVATFEYQKNNQEANVSSIDLGTCEQSLKASYGIDDNQSLIVFKIDYKNPETKKTYVQYEIYSPNNFSNPLNLSVCNNAKITISTPVDLDDNSIQIYESLSSQGFNIFDSSDDFYTDVCSVYTTENGTDMLIEDRKKDIYYSVGNISMCQDGCELSYYNTTTKKSVCACEPQVEETSTENIDTDKFSAKQLGDKFLKTITNSNFIVMKCYKLAFDTKKLFKNIGRIIMTLFLIFYIVALFVYIFSERKKINMFIKQIIKSKENLNDIKNKSRNKNSEKDEKLKIKRRNKKDSSKTNNESTAKEIKSKSKEKSKKKHSKSKGKKIKKSPPKKKSKERNNKNRKKEYYNNSNTNINSNSANSLNTKNKKNENSISINIFPIYKTSKKKLKNSEKAEKMEKKIEKFGAKKNIYFPDIDKKNSSKRINCQTEGNIENFISYNDLNDEELNTLEYKLAIVIDKRSYFQYYWSLLKKKQLILFTILPANDYNLYSLKIALFILSFSLYFTINCFFFTDSTMRKINSSGGKFDFLYQIPQIIYSSLISALINMLLKNLSLSEKSLLKLKQATDKKRAEKQSKSIRRCIVIKFIIFFIISNILLLFFWYFITCFCAVYTNTQKALFKDTFVSFGLSMIYPFGLNLIPGWFRIPALRSKTSPYIYKISGYIAII